MKTLIAYPFIYCIFTTAHFFHSTYCHQANVFFSFDRLTKRHIRKSKNLFLRDFYYFFKTTSLLSICLLMFGCISKNNRLPILGNPTIVGKDTVYPAIPAFKFINQDGLEVTEKTFEDKIYIADFIFLSCPTICPKMTKEMAKVYESYKSNPNILFISHTIDPINDSIPRLKSYSHNLGVDSKKWFFVTGDKERIYSLAEESYYATAYSDSTALGGYVHSGGLLLVDKNKHIRGVYDGTDQSETKRLISDIENLLNEQF